MDQITKIDLGSTPAAREPLAVRTPTHNSLEASMGTKKSKMLVPFVIVAIIAGTVTGTMLAKKQLLLAGGSGVTAGMTQNPEDANAVKVGSVFGSKDEKTFRDSAEGVIQPGGIAGEGSHHLVRGDNQSQWVYLTSSVVDLDNFVGHKVTIWGETVGAKKAGWLMDVGRLKVLELNAAEINAIEPTE